MQAAVTTGSAEHPAFPARWLYGVLRALPGDRLHCPRYRATQMRRRVRDNACALMRGISTGMPGPHGLAVRTSAFVGALEGHCALARPPLPASRFVTIATRPSHRGGMRRI